MVTHERASVQLCFSGGDAEYPLDEALLSNNISLSPTSGSDRCE
jgi:hypothetical protein